MNNYIQAGETIELTAPSGGVVSGLGYQIGSLFVVAVATVAETLPFQGRRCGLFELVKNAGEVWTEGMPIYWDATNNEATYTAAGNLYIGVASEAALTAAVLAKVLLAGSATPRRFVSAETLATGSAQNVAHGLGVVPSEVLIAMTEHPGTPDTGAMDIAEGTHTSTNIVFTATANIKVKILAWA